MLSLKNLLKNTSQVAHQCHALASLYNPLSVRMAESAGFQFGILGGSVAALEVLGAPDYSLITLTEFAEQARRLTRVAKMPILADGDAGYGNALNTMRAVEELEHAGIAGITLEDTIMPCGYGKSAPQFVSTDEAVGKLKAALRARRHDDFMLIARTHAGYHSPDVVRERLRAFEATGVDALCLIGIKDMAHLQSVLPSPSVPVMLVTYGNSAFSDGVKLAELGVRLTLDGHGGCFSAIQAAYHSFCCQQNKEASVTDAQDLVRLFSKTDNYLSWAKTFMQVPDIQTT